jgi:hypothetical protein
MQKIGLVAFAVFGNRFEILGQRLDLLDLIGANRGGLLFHRSQLGFEMLGGKAALGIGGGFPHEQPLWLVKLEGVFAPIASAPIGKAQFHPIAGGVNGAAKLLGINKGLGDEHRMVVAGLPIGAQALQRQSKRAGTSKP